MINLISRSYNAVLELEIAVGKGNMTVASFQLHRLIFQSICKHSTMEKKDKIRSNGGSNFFLVIKTKHCSFSLWKFLFFRHVSVFPLGESSKKKSIVTSNYANEEKKKKRERERIMIINALT